MDSLEAKPVPGTEGAVTPFFSPDGQWLGFFAGGKLKKVSVGGGAALTLGECCGASRGQLGQPRYDRLRTHGPEFSSKCADAGGTPQPLTRFDERGVCPPLAGVLARRQSSALCCRNESSRIGPTRRLRSNC